MEMNANATKMMLLYKDTDGLNGVFLPFVLLTMVKKTRTSELAKNVDFNAIHLEYFLASVAIYNQAILLSVISPASKPS